MAKDLHLTNIPTMSVGEAVHTLAGAYGSLINKGEGVKTMPSVMLWGPPGVGKSQGVRQIAEELEGSTGRQVHVTDVRLLLFNPIDLRGIPTANEDKTLAVWLKPKIFDMDPSEEVINILFLDEISSAPQSVQAAAYQITLDRVVGEHKLPDNCIVIAAGNRVTDKSVAYKMPKALANRLLHIEIEVSLSAWRTWAVFHGIHPMVLGYLEFQPEALMGFGTSAEELAYASPRTWEMVSNILNSVSDDVDAVFLLIAGLVGMGAASEFRAWSQVYRDLPEMEEIFAGRARTMPKSADCLYALVSAMTAYARDHRDDLEQIRNSIIYASHMPPDFSVVLLKDYLSIEKDYRKKLMQIPEFVRWLQTKGSMLNGII